MLAQTYPAEQTLGMRALRQTPLSVLQWLITQLICYPAMGFVSCWSPKREVSPDRARGCMQSQASMCLGPAEPGDDGTIMDIKRQIENKPSLSPAHYCGQG